MVASVRDVARHAGVSLGTVSNVLNNPDVVAPATRQRVLDAIADLGFVRNEAARHLRAGRSRTIGMVVIDVANPFFTDVARGAEAVAEASDAMVMLCNSANDVARERRHLDQLVGLRVMGLLVSPMGEHTQRLQEIVDRGIPVVLVDRTAGSMVCCSVAVDDVSGGSLAVQHLLDQGHERIAFIGGPFSTRQVSDRRAGATGALTERGAPELTVLPTGALTVADGVDAAARVLDMPARTRPTAVFCANDLLALGVLQEFTRQGAGVPGDVAIVGYDDIGFAAAAAVPLSSVRQPRDDLGRTAAELLLDEVENGDRHRHRQVVFQPDLVVRDSSGRTRRGTPAAAPAARARQRAG